MGQCSTLPAEGRTAQEQPVGRFGQKDFGMDDGSNVHQPPSRGRVQYRRGDSTNNVLQVTVPCNDEKDTRRRDTPPTSPQTYQTRQSSQSSMMQEDVREAPPIVENAKRARCYQLNLDSDFVGMSGDVRVEGSLLGPYEPTPPLTYSASDDSDGHMDPTTIAIRTAQIFRGITIAKDGTILAQNARATRSNRGNKPKRGEKSRQAAKIEKAKDLVEESILTGKVCANYFYLLLFLDSNIITYLHSSLSIITNRHQEATNLPT